jgi:hypothetical protein
VLLNKQNVRLGYYVLKRMCLKDERWRGEVVYLELWQVQNKDPGTRNVRQARPASTCTSSGKKGVNDAIHPIPLKSPP